MVEVLRQGQFEDLSLASHAELLAPGVLLFPNEKWARRLVGVYANQLANESLDRTHAVLVEKTNGREVVVSVRSAKKGNQSAAQLCKHFPTGGGRLKAAGINALAKDQIPDFVVQFKQFFQQ